MAGGLEAGRTAACPSCGGEGHGFGQGPSPPRGGADGGGNPSAWPGCGLPSVAVPEAVLALGTWLRAERYADAYAHALDTDGPVARPFAPSLSALLRACPPGWPAPLWMLLAGGARCASADLPADLRRLVPDLVEAGWLAPEADGGVRAAGWVAVGCCGGLLLPAGPPAAYGRPAARPRAYLGPDSLWLARRVPAMAPGSLTWDLGCGTGILGLSAARGGGRAVLTDLDGDAVRAAAAAAAWNDRASTVRAGAGDLAAPVAGLRFDLVVALLPYLPVAPGAWLSRSAGGGPDGTALLRRALAALPRVLKPDGRFLSFAYLLADAGAPLLLREPPPPGLRLRVQALASIPGDDLAPLLAEHAPGGLGADAAAAYRAHLAELGATEAVAALVHASPCGAGGPAGDDRGR